MKRTIIFLLFIVAVFCGCSRNFDNSGGKTASETTSKTVGSGATKVDKRTVPAFTAVDIHGAYDVQIVAQKEQQVEIEADDNLLPLIKTEVKGGTLVISNEQSLSTRGKLHVRINVPTLDGVNTSGASDLNITGVKSDAFKIGSSGTGNFKIAGETKTLEVKLSGAGDLDAKDLHAEKVNVTSSGAANADVYATEELHVNASGAGNVNYYGDPKVVTKDSSGVASINKK